MKGFKLQKIWDPSTRIWHWLLALSVTAGLILGKFMAFETIMWHFYLGYFTLALILIRIVRGFFGPDVIKFKSLIPSYSALTNYVKTMRSKSPSGTAGHNPIGSLSVIAMVLLISGQAISGLFMQSDDFFEYGPLSGYASNNILGYMAWLHYTFANIIIVVVALHVLAILYYLIWKKENLIKPMFTGWKLVKGQSNNHSAKK